MGCVIGIDLGTTLRFITSEQASALSLTAAWLLGGTIAGATREDWARIDGADHRAAPLGVARLLRGWAVAAPIAFVAKFLVVAAVYLPAGGSVRHAQPGDTVHLRHASWAWPKTRLRMCLASRALACTLERQWGSNGPALRTAR